MLQRKLNGDNPIQSLDIHADASIEYRRFGHHSLVAHEAACEKESTNLDVLSSNQYVWKSKLDIDY